jgi:hypothetical protein
LQAIIDADLTIALLRAIGITPEPDKPITLPASLLLDLGAAMRIRAWESDGIDPRRLGLPAAKDALRRVLRDGEARAHNSTSAPSLSPAVLRAAGELLAWAGPSDLGADLLLDYPDEDKLVEAIARYLWERREPAVGEGTPSS